MKEMPKLPPENQRVELEGCKIPDIELVTFDKLYAKYQESIRLYLLSRVQDEGIAEEYCNDIFLKTWQKYVSLIKTGKLAEFQLKSWLYQCADNKIIDHYRHNRNIKVFIMAQDEMDSLIVESQEVLSIESIDTRRALDYVPTVKRACLVAYANGYEQQEIAKRLNIEKSTVSSYVRRAREEVKKNMGSYSRVFKEFERLKNETGFYVAIENYVYSRMNKEQGIREVESLKTYFRKPHNTDKVRFMYLRELRSLDEHGDVAGRERLSAAVNLLMDCQSFPCSPD
jgi:RNA polymerase sigma-70 factor (ECF subfamily)